MRYVRTTTPTNIYSLEPTFIVDRTNVTCFKTHGDKGRYVNDTIETEENLEKWLKYNKTSILKQADTIEELCDGYVVRRYVMDEPCHWFYITKEKMKADISLRNSAYTIFGAIWTDKGLIYVAKLNDKGELELL